MRHFVVGSLGLLTVVAAHAQAPYEPHGAQPPKDAGYLLADGTIRIVGWDDLAPMFERLNALYVKTHPGTKLTYVKGNLYTPQHSIIFDETAFAPTGMEFSTGLNSAYQSQVHAPTYAIRIAHGAVQGDAELGPLAFIVNKANPLERLSPAQLLHIFTVGGRAPDILAWKQAGVKGDLGESEIHAYGLPSSDHFFSEDPGFGPYLFRDKWGFAQNARQYAMQKTYADVVRRVAEDPAGIGITAVNRVTPDVKVLGLTAGEWGKPMRGTREDILGGRYPYDRFIYVYVRRLPGRAIDPFAREYLRIVLSKEGQEAIAADSKGYLPLNPAELAAELARLD
ncbi:MAG: PstS family phosphate ABC transporter substrate-binding protein [Bacillota bacterium]